MLFSSALTRRTPRTHIQIAFSVASFVTCINKLQAYANPMSGYDASFLSKRHIQKHLNNEYHAVRTLNLALKPTRLYEFPYNQLCHNTSNYSLTLI
jgi:hypothetical protein